MKHVTVFAWNDKRLVVSRVVVLEQQESGFAGVESLIDYQVGLLRKELDLEVDDPRWQAIESSAHMDSVTTRFHVESIIRD